MITRMDNANSEPAMLYVSSYRCPTRQQRRDLVPVILAFVITLTVLTLGAGLARLTTQPREHAIFPPVEWAVAPPDWTD